MSNQFNETQGEAMQEIEELLKKDKFFVYGRVGIDEWDWEKEGSNLAIAQRKHPIASIMVDIGKLMGMFRAISDLQKAKAEILSRFSELERKIANHKKDKDEAVKSVRIQYDSVCDMFHKREREYEDRITDLNNALINQLETGKQKTIYINQLEKENERLKNDGWVKRVYQLLRQLDFRFHEKE